MYNAICKSLAMAAVVLFAAACGDSRSDAARELCRQSESEIAAGRHYAAIGLLDTLDSRYRDLTEVRRSGMAIRARAMEGIALDSIPLYDARLAAATLAVDSMRPLFEHVDGAPGIDGYYLPKGTDRRAFATTGIQGRVSDDGLFYRQCGRAQHRTACAGIAQWSRDMHLRRYLACQSGYSPWLRGRQLQS